MLVVNLILSRAHNKNRGSSEMVRMHCTGNRSYNAREDASNNHFKSGLYLQRFSEVTFEQTTDASSLWLQLCSFHPLCEQFTMEPS